MLHPLEPRLCLSATLTNGQLSILGTNQNDQISVSRSKTAVTVTEKTIQVSGNVTIITLLGKHTFLPSAISSIIIRTSSGNDSVSLTGGTANPFSYPTTLDGGDGNDTLTGGAGADSLLGGGADLPPIPTKTSGDNATTDLGDLVTSIRRVTTISPA